MRRRFGVVPDIDMEKGTAIVNLPKPVVLDFAGLMQDAVKSSHRLRILRIDVPGRVVDSPQGPILEVAGSGQRLTVDFGGRQRPEGEVRVRGRLEPPDFSTVKVEGVGRD